MKPLHMTLQPIGTSFAGSGCLRNAISQMSGEPNSLHSHSLLARFFNFLQNEEREIVGAFGAPSGLDNLNQTAPGLAIGSVSHSDHL